MVFGRIIVVKKDGSEGAFFEINSNILIGRSIESDIRLKISNVSRKQSQIVVDENGTCNLENLSQSNPTYLNGKPIFHPVELKDKDEISLGGRTFLFQSATTPLTQLAIAAKENAVMKHTPVLQSIDESKTLNFSRPNIKKLLAQSQVSAVTDCSEENDEQVSNVKSEGQEQGQGQGGVGAMKSLLSSQLRLRAPVLDPQSSPVAAPVAPVVPEVAEASVASGSTATATITGTPSKSKPFKMSTPMRNAINSRRQSMNATAEHAGRGEEEAVVASPALKSSLSVVRPPTFDPAIKEAINARRKSFAITASLLSNMAAAMAEASTPTKKNKKNNMSTTTGPHSSAKETGLPVPKSALKGKRELVMDALERSPEKTDDVPAPSSSSSSSSSSSQAPKKLNSSIKAAINSRRRISLNSSSSSSSSVAVPSTPLVAPSTPTVRPPATAPPATALRSCIKPTNATATAIATATATVCPSSPTPGIIDNKAVDLNQDLSQAESLHQIQNRKKLSTPLRHAIASRGSSSTRTNAATPKKSSAGAAPAAAGAAGSVVVNQKREISEHLKTAINARRKSYSTTTSTVNSRAAVKTPKKTITDAPVPTTAPALAPVAVPAAPAPATATAPVALTMFEEIKAKMMKSIELRQRVQHKAECESRAVASAPFAIKNTEEEEGEQGERVKEEVAVDISTVTAAVASVMDVVVEEEGKSDMQEKSTMDVSAAAAAAAAADVVVSSVPQQTICRMVASKVSSANLLRAGVKYQTSRLFSAMHRPVYAFLGPHKKSMTVPTSRYPLRQLPAEFTRVTRSSQHTAPLSSPLKVFPDWDARKEAGKEVEAEVEVEVANKEVVTEEVEDEEENEVEVDEDDIMSVVANCGSVSRTGAVTIRPFMTPIMEDALALTCAQIAIDAHANELEIHGLQADEAYETAVNTFLENSTEFLAQQKQQLHEEEYNGTDCDGEAEADAAAGAEAAAGTGAANEDDAMVVCDEVDLASMDLIQSPAPAQYKPRRRESLLLSIEKKAIDRFNGEDDANAAIDGIEAESVDISCKLVKSLTDADMAVIEAYSLQLVYSGVDEEDAFHVAMKAFISGLQRTMISKSPATTSSTSSSVTSGEVEKEVEEEQEVEKAVIVDHAQPVQLQTISAADSDLHLGVSLRSLFHIPLSTADYTEDDAEKDAELVSRYADEMNEYAGVDAAIAYGVALDCFLADPKAFREKVRSWCRPAPVAVDDEVELNPSLHAAAAAANADAVASAVAATPTATSAVTAAPSTTKRSSLRTQDKSNTPAPATSFTPAPPVLAPTPVEEAAAAASALNSRSKRTRAVESSTKVSATPIISTCAPQISLGESSVRRRLRRKDDVEEEKVTVVSGGVDLFNDSAAAVAAVPAAVPAAAAPTGESAVEVSTAAPVDESVTEASATALVDEPAAEFASCKKQTRSKRDKTTAVSSAVTPVVEPLTKRGKREVKQQAEVEAEVVEKVVVVEVDEAEIEVVAASTAKKSTRRGGSAVKKSKQEKEEEEVVVVDTEPSATKEEGVEEEDIALAILCDGCDGEHLLEDLGLQAVPEGDWFCPSCEAKRSKKRGRGGASAPRSEDKEPAEAESTRTTRARRGAAAAVAVDEVPPSASLSSATKKAPARRSTRKA